MTRKRSLLYITPSLPYPPRRGFEVIPFHRLRLLSDDFRITLAFIDNGSVKPTDIDQLRAFCISIIPLPLSSLGRFGGLAKSTFTGIPFQVGCFTNSHIRRLLADLCNTNTFDIIHAYMLRLAELIPRTKTPVVIDLVDSMILNFERRIPNAPLHKKLILREEVRRLRIYEPSIARSYPYIVVSDIDRNCIGGSGTVIPLGIDTSCFHPGETPSDGESLIFTGNMFYEPNQQAVKWFLNHCWPALRRRKPNLALRIAGNDPPSWLKAQHGFDGIAVFGSVPSIADEIRRAHVAVAPMQSGSGMQFKILEAMACGKPVVATKLGRGAILAEHQRSIVIADTPDDTISAILDLLDNSDHARNISLGGLRLVQQHYTWESHCDKVRGIYDSLISNPSQHTKTAHDA